MSLGRVFGGLFRNVVLRQSRTIPTAREGFGSEEEFKVLWTRVRGSRILQAIFPFVKNPFRLSYSDFLYCSIISVLTEQRNEYILPSQVEWDRPELLKQIKDGTEACIVLSRHHVFAHTGQAMLNLGREVATVAKNRDRTDSLYKRSGSSDTKRIEIIDADSKCFVRLLGACRAGKVICCNPDIFNSETRKFEFVSGDFFEFSQRARIPLYFAKYSVTPEGELEGNIRGPHADGDAAKLVADFIRFFEPDVEFTPAPPNRLE
jgi:hypothetical protein